MVIPDTVGLSLLRTDIEHRLDYSRKLKRRHELDQHPCEGEAPQLRHAESACQQEHAEKISPARHDLVDEGKLHQPGWHHPVQRQGDDGPYRLHSGRACGTAGGTDCQIAGLSGRVFDIAGSAGMYWAAGMPIANCVSGMHSSGSMIRGCGMGMRKRPPAARYAACW